MKRASTAVLLGLLGTSLLACGGGKSATTRAGSAPVSAGSAPVSATGSTHAPSPSTATPPPSQELSAGVVQSSSGAVSATMHASSHHPRVNRPWPVSFTVSNAGRPVRAEVRYEYMFAGQVVAHRSDYRFTGHFHDTFLWPSSALGYPLTFRAVILAGGRTFYLDYPVQVKS